jgi:hypothetical protein
MNITGVSIDGLNEMKFQTKNNHESLVDFMQFDTKQMIKRSNARITNGIDAVNKCFCYRHFSHKSSL